MVLSGAMMRRAFVLALVLIAVQTTYARAAITAKDIQRARENLRKAYPASFDTTAWRLPNSYAGSDPFWLSIALGSQRKDEFESTREFETRLSKPVRPDTLFAFSIAIDNIQAIIKEAAGTSYDADSARLTITAPCRLLRSSADRIRAIFGEQQQSIAVVRLYESRDRAGSLYFGGKGPVFDGEGNARAGEFGNNGFPCGMTWNIALSPNRARAIKPRADRLLFICSLQPHYPEPVVLDHSEFNMVYPGAVHESKTAHDCLSVDLIGVWLYNFATGDVLLKLRGWEGVDPASEPMPR